MTSPTTVKAVQALRDYDEAEHEYGLVLDSFATKDAVSRRDEEDLEAAREWAETRAHDALHALRTAATGDPGRALSFFFPKGEDQ